MKQAIMDIGSNSMRVTVYEVDGTVFRILFKAKNYGRIGRVCRNEKNYLRKELNVHIPAF